MIYAHYAIRIVGEKRRWDRVITPNPSKTIKSLFDDTDKRLREAEAECGSPCELLRIDLFEG